MEHVIIALVNLGALSARKKEKEQKRVTKKKRKTRNKSFISH
jgi:hypothetical protein